MGLVNMIDHTTWSTLHEKQSKLNIQTYITSIFSVLPIMGLMHVCIWVLALSTFIYDRWNLHDKHFFSLAYYGINACLHLGSSIIYFHLW